MTDKPNFAGLAGISRRIDHVEIERQKLESKLAWLDKERDKLEARARKIEARMSDADAVVAVAKNPEILKGRKQTVDETNGE